MSMPKYSESLHKSNSESHIYLFSDLLSNGDMKTIDQIRLDNLETAIKFFGSAAALASKATVNEAYLSQVRTGQLDTKTRKPRAMGRVTARKIDRAMEKSPGWMDTDHSENSSDAELPSADDDIQMVIKIMGATDAAGRTKIRVAAEDIRDERIAHHRRINTDKI